MSNHATITLISYLALAALGLSSTFSFAKAAKLLNTEAYVRSQDLDCI